MSAWDLIDLQNKYLIAIKRIKELEEEIRRLKMPKYSDTYDIPEDDWKLPKCSDTYDIPEDDWK